MKSNYFKALFFLLAMLSLPCLGQREITGNQLKDRLYFAGNVGASISSNYIYVQVSPRIGCMITNHFSVGTGLSYLYLKNTLNGVGSSVYGGNIFARHNFLQNFFVQTELEVLNLKYSAFNPVSQEINTKRIWVPGWLIGGGIFQRVGTRGGITLAGFYNLLYDSKRSPYNSPFVVRAGFNF